MTQLNISLPDSVYDWVSSQVKAGKFASNSDYIRELIIQVQQQQVQQQQLLQQAITEGLESGISELSVADIIKEAKIELNTR